MSLIPADLRLVVVQRAGNRCEYCRLSQDSQVATFPVDHIVPITMKGLTEAFNLALACPRCNARKWVHSETEDPVSGNLTPLFNPRVQAWEEHFRWSLTDPATIEAITPTGRATAALLGLNDPAHLAIRRWLMAVGLHPGA